MTQSPDELFDYVDDQDRVLGQAFRRDVHSRKLNHRAVHILLFNPQGELFLQQRAATKDSQPLKLDSSASGHLGAGEEYDACAVRELAEELGITVPFAALRKLVRIPTCAETGWEFVWVYSLTGDYQPVINPDEIVAGRFWPLAEIRAEIAARPERFAPCFIKVFDEYRRFG
jgi:isopentenyldiphosphate isomerase